MSSTGSAVVGSWAAQRARGCAWRERGREGAREPLSRECANRGPSPQLHQIGSVNSFLKFHPITLDDVCQPAPLPASSLLPLLRAPRWDIPSRQTASLSPNRRTLSTKSPHYREQTGGSPKHHTSRPRPPAVAEKVPFWHGLHAEAVVAPAAI
jgi:hypothetical protein